MDALEWITVYGLWGLFLVTFLGATLVPLSTEIFVFAALELQFDPLSVFGVATLGNCLGATLNYALGWHYSARIEKKLRTYKSGRKAILWMHKHGKWSLSASWLPIIGDPLCLAAGIFKISLPYFTTLGLGTRMLRYALLVGLIDGII